MKSLSVVDAKSISGGNDSQSTIVVQNKYADCEAKEYIAVSSSVVFFSGVGALAGGPLGIWMAQGVSMTRTSFGGGLAGAGIGALGGAAVGLCAGALASLFCRASAHHASA